MIIELCFFYSVVLSFFFFFFFFSSRRRHTRLQGDWSSDVCSSDLLKSGNLKPAGDPIMGRLPLLVNDDVLIARCRPSQPQQELYRNAAADEVIFIHRGKGTLHTMFGALPFKPYDYVVVPHTTTYRLEFEQ